ncbi:MAG TPA: hypothetical protein VLM38_16840 [Blastocatellia bacterium]|nr:hypothetical protein [Blastocatellia bacterium]
MIKRMICAAALAVLAPTFATAQVERGVGSPKSNANEILRAAKQHIHNGEQCLLRGDADCARREFDSAIDEVLESGIDLRTDQYLLAGWREIIETINRHELAPLSADGRKFWKPQEFEGRPPEDDTPGKTEPGPLDTGTFQTRFAELQRRFSEKYGREITLTGADHAEHRRLYGSGSAYDIRVRDLTREQVNFIIANGRGLGLRIKDFSTWESVAAHNARSRMLGRPSDTLATGVHLHIDRMALPGNTKMISKPAVSSKPRREPKQ